MCVCVKAGHEVVHLPVAHCTLNPIELAWSQVKGYIKTNNRRFNLEEVASVAKEGFEVVTPECWAKLVKHVQEDHYWQVDRLARTYTIPEFVIHTGSNDDDSDESSSDSETTSDSDSDCDNPMADDD